MHFELAVNMKATKALGVRSSRTIAMRATHVIQLPSTRFREILDDRAMGRCVSFT